jgi:hypothetical protein
LEDCVELVRNRFHNLELRYEDGWFINPDDKREWHGTVLKVRQTALQPIKEHADKICTRSGRWRRIQLQKPICHLGCWSQNAALMAKT